MSIKKVVAIIGSTGNMGSAVAKAIAKGGDYRILLFSREQEKLEALVQDIRAEQEYADVVAQGCPEEASWEADIIILALPYQAEAAMVEKIKAFATQKIVISIANPLNDTYDGLITASDTSAAEQLQQLLPDSYVVKAFNTTFAADFYQPLIDDVQVDSFVAGDHEDAVAQVSELVKQAGFHPVVAGKLSQSRVLEQMQCLLIQLNIKNDYGWHAGWKIVHH